MEKKLEKLAEQIYKEMLADGEEVTKEEALEMAQMELGAKEIKNYVQSTVEKKPKAKRVIKLDEIKVDLVKQISAQLDKVLINEQSLKEISIKNPQKEITFKIGSDEYSLNLVKHRPSKEKK